MNPKWHFKIKQFNVKTADAILRGPLTNKSFTSKKVLTHLCVVKTVEQKLEQLTTTVADKADQDNLSRLLVPIVAHKTQYHFSREATSRYFAVTVLEKVKELNNSFSF